MADKKRIVILGGGYAGVRVARDLGRLKKRHGHDFAAEIILLNRDEYHCDVTSFYEVATAYLHVDSNTSSERIRNSVRAPLKDIVAKLPVQLQFEVVDRISPQEKLLHLSSGKTLSWDILVVAVGSGVATFGIKGVADNSYIVRTLPDALRLRHHIVQQFKRSCDLEGAAHSSALTFVVVGGGASGVETAAELTGHARHQCVKHDVDPAEVRVVLVEAGERVLGNLPEKVSQETMRRLQEMGVEVLVNKRISEVNPESVSFADGKTLATQTTIWTAGIKPAELLHASGLPIERWGVTTEQTLQVRGFEDIFAVGDAAVIPDSTEPIPATVPAAYTEGALAAKNIARRLRGEKLEAYMYDAPGVLVTVGSKFGVAVLPHGKVLTGRLPLLAKKLVTLQYWLSYLPPLNAVRLWWRGLRVQSKND